MAERCHPAPSPAAPASQRGPPPAFRFPPRNPDFLYEDASVQDLDLRLEQPRRSWRRQVAGAGYSSPIRTQYERSPAQRTYSYPTRGLSHPSTPRPGNSSTAPAPSPRVQMARTRSSALYAPSYGSRAAARAAPMHKAKTSPMRSRSPQQLFSHMDRDGNGQSGQPHSSTDTLTNDVFWNTSDVLR